MKRTILLTALISILIPFAGCRSAKGTSQVETSVVAPKMTGTNSSAFLPKASVFKINPEYADKVGVSLNPDGSLAYFPAPSDINPQSAPYPLGDGWYLNRQGLAPESVFTTWTFEDYSALPAAPSPEEILAAVIPGSCVTDYTKLPLYLSDALATPALCLPYLKNK